MNHAITIKEDNGRMKKIVLFLLAVVIIMSAVTIVTNAVGYDTALGGGRTTWSADDIMYPGDEGTKYHGAFVQPDVWNPIDGQYEHWTGCLFERTTYNGVECVKVSIDPEGTTLVPMMDFNYYQWNAEYYMPSLDATKNSWLKIKYAYNDAADAMSYVKFHASKDVAPLGASVLKSAFKTFDIVNGGGEWQEVIVNLSDMIFEDGTAWNENTIRQFRLQMFEGNENPDAACYIAGFGFFETEDAAKAWDYKTTTAENKLVATSADIIYTEYSDRIIIDGKTHYLVNSETVENYLAVYTINEYGDAWKKIADKDVKQALEGKFYDITLIDEDVNGYYEVALVNFYNIDTYKAPTSTGKETYGVMMTFGAVNAEYSEVLSVGDVVVYTYDYFMNKVDVKSVLKAYEGKITAYSEVSERDYAGKRYTVATIEINDEEYEISYYDAHDKSVDAFGVVGNVANLIDEDAYETDLAEVAKENVADFASAYVGEEYEYYLFNDTLLAWGKEVDPPADNYLVVEDFTDFEIYDHVVLSAFVDGKEESIKVKKIYEKKANGVKRVWADIEGLDYGRLANKLADIFGIYSYTIDEEGFYTLTKHNATLRLKDFVSTVGDGYVNFNDWETVNVLDTNGNGNIREEIIRVNSATTIYLVDVNGQKVTMVKPSSYFTINLKNDTDTAFIIDRIGYGNSEKEYVDGIGYGIASVMYIVTDGEYINHEDYKFVYVQEDVLSISSGSAVKYELETGDEEETYFKYIADDEEAYLATVTFEAVEEIFVSKTYRTNYLGGADLVPGLYLLNSDNIVMDHKTVAELSAESAYDRYLTYNRAQFCYDVWSISADDIDLYNYKYKTISGKSALIGNKIQNIKFRFFEESNGDILAVDKSNQELVDYMEYNFGYEDDPGIYYDVNVLIIPNTPSGFNRNFPFTDDTLTGIVFDEVTSDDPSITIPPVETASASYLVVTDCTDFEIYDHVVLSALVNGAEEEIRVKMIYEKQSNGDRTVWADIEDLGYGKLANKLEDIFGIYSYVVDADGFYTLTKHNATLQLKDFVSTIASGYVDFMDWETVDVKDDNANGNRREEIIRVNSDTNIYVVNQFDQKVTMVKPLSYFSINFENDTAPVFMIDKIGYGNPEEGYIDGIKYGVASVIYIVTTGDVVVGPITITYDANDGSGAPNAQRKTYGVALALSNTIPVRYGHRFVNWKASDGTTYAPGTSYTANTSTTMTAQWAPGIYTVTLNPNGGMLSDTSEIVIYDSKYGTLPTPTLTGYTFAGWYTAERGGIRITSNSTVAITANQTLYARWFANEYTITYNANGGSGAPTAQTKTHDIALTLSSDVPTRSGYTFKGWATSVSGSVAYAAGDSYTANEDATLYAVWEKDEIVIPETDANIVVAGGRCRAGETVDVTISLENNPGVAFMRLSVDYDSNAMKLVDVKDAGILGIEVHSDNLTSDPYTLYWENSTIRNNITSNGTAVTLTFEVDENAEEGSYPITVTYDNTKDDIMDVDFGEVYFNVVNGAVEVVDFIYGDVNGDFEVTPVDSATLSRYLAKWTGYGEDVIDPDASDVNCDGEVTAVDSAMLSRHLAKWTGYETLPIEE